MRAPVDEMVMHKKPIQGQQYRTRKLLKKKQYVCDDQEVTEKDNQCVCKSCLLSFQYCLS